MMNLGKTILRHAICLILSGILLALSGAGIVDEFWTGMGAALLAVSVVRLVQVFRLRKDEAYREQYETEMADERNRFLRNKAWACAGYLFILIAAAASIALRVLGHELLSYAASGAVCLVMLLYWGAYLALRKKY